MDCLSECPICGAEKDYRAELCKSCAMSKKQKRQWEQNREKMLSAVRESNRKRRRTYDDISEDTNWQVKGDGRHYVYYWDGEEKKCVYRYQWKWKQAHGEIPEGHHIHHKNGDTSDDRLENLACVEGHSHHQLHGREMVADKLHNRRAHVCETCGTEFMRKPRKNRPDRFCSLDCYHEALRSST